MHSSMIGMAMGIFLVFLSSSMALPIGDSTPMYETSSPSSLKHEPRSIFVGDQAVSSFDRPLISSVNVLPGNSIIGTSWSGAFVKRHEVGDNDLESSTPKATETGDKKEPRDILLESNIQPAAFNGIGPASYSLGGSYFLRRGLNDLESSTPRYHGLTETASDEKAPRAFIVDNGPFVGGSVVYDPVNAWSGNSYFLRRGLGNMNDLESSTPKDEKVPRDLYLGNGGPLVYDSVISPVNGWSGNSIFLRRGIPGKMNDLESSTPMSGHMTMPPTRTDKPAQ